MRIIKSNVSEADKTYAFDILNKLRNGVRVFGKPAEGLQKTLLKLETPEKDSFDSAKYNLNDSEYEEEVAKLKKGIKGEKTLGEYFEKIIRLDDTLSDIVVFASLGDEDTDKDYIPDTDFLCVYGNNILIVDAKNINTNPDIPLFVSGNGIYSAVNHDVPILEVNPSNHVWAKIFEQEYNNSVDIDGCTCIINKSGSEIFRDEEWLSSPIKPVHISELIEFLHTWVKGKEPVFDLELLTVIAKKQIWEEKTDLDLTYGKRVFGV